MKCTPAGRCGATAAITARLTEPTSVTVAPGFSRGAIAAATSAIAPTGTQSTTRSASSTAAAAVSKTSARPRRAASARVAALRAWPVMLTAAAGAAQRVADRGGDQAEADQRHPAVGHQARTFMNSATASATRSQASASPTVMRKAAGSL